MKPCLCPEIPSERQVEAQQPGQATKLALVGHGMTQCHLQDEGAGCRCGVELVRAALGNEGPSCRRKGTSLAKER